MARLVVIPLQATPLPLAVIPSTVVVAVVAALLPPAAHGQAELQLTAAMAVMAVRIQAALVQPGLHPVVAAVARYKVERLAQVPTVKYA